MISCFRYTIIGNASHEIIIRIAFFLSVFLIESKILAQVPTNPVLVKKLDSLGKEDQKWRNLIGEVESGKIDTIDRETVMRNWLKTDSLNLIEAKKIFTQYGFPGNDLVGEKGSMMYFLLVQHADKDPAFQEKVLQALKSQVDKRNAAPKLYAYLLDRVKVNKGEKQVYGTQLRPKQSGQGMELAPVIEPDKLNERRASVNLPPIEEYLKMMGVESK
jgi:hypothetical protein